MKLLWLFLSSVVSFSMWGQPIPEAKVRPADKNRFVPKEYNRHFYPEPQVEQFPETAPKRPSAPENFAPPRRHPRRYKEPTVPTMPITPAPRSSPADH